MATMMQWSLSLLLVLISIVWTSGQVSFQSLCSPEVEVNGLTSVDGSDEFEIDLYENRFLPDDTILSKIEKKNEHSISHCLINHHLFSVSIKQKRQNYGIGEFFVRAFDTDNNVVGRFDDRQTGNLILKHHTCANDASVSRSKLVD